MTTGEAVPYRGRTGVRHTRNAAPAAPTGSRTLEATFTSVSYGWAQVERWKDNGTLFGSEPYLSDGRNDQTGSHEAGKDVGHAIGQEIKGEDGTAKDAATEADAAAAEPAKP